VYSREINGEILTLAASGWTYNFSFVLYDHETETMWLPVNVGDGGPNSCGCVMWGFAGPFAGRFLHAYPSSNTNWNIWWPEHPDTKIMKTE